LNKQYLIQGKIWRYRTGNPNP